MIHSLTNIYFRLHYFTITAGPFLCKKHQVKGKANPIPIFQPVPREADIGGCCKMLFLEMLEHLGNVLRLLVFVVLASAKDNSTMVLSFVASHVVLKKQQGVPRVKKRRFSATVAEKRHPDLGRS